MRAHEFEAGQINPDILHPDFRVTQRIGEYRIRAWSETGSRGDRYLHAVAYSGPESDPLNKIADITFKVHGTGDSGFLESITTWVAQEFRRRGVASTVYAYIRSLGNTIRPSQFQTPPGQAMWRGWQRSGGAQHLIRESISSL